jgi:hypothetical protein
MAIDLQNSQNISTGWGRPPDFSAPSIGSLVSGILENRYRNQKLQQESIADAIKQYQSQRESSAYIEAAQKAGLLPEGDYGGLGLKGGSDIARLIAHQNEAAAREAYMKPYYQALTERAGRPDAGRGGGTPRYDYHGVLLTGAEYQRKLDQDAVAHDIGKLSAQEAEAQGKIAGYQAKYGIDPENSASGGLKGNPTPADVADYLHWNQEAARIRKQKENYKWFRGTVQPPGGAQTDEEDDGSITLPQGGATPPPSISQKDVNQVQQAPGITPSPIPYDQSIPTGTPRPNAPPPADSAAGHTSTYGTPAPGGGAATGDLVPGQSRRYVAGKWWVWDGSQWQPE